LIMATVSSTCYYTCEQKNISDGNHAVFSLSGWSDTLRAPDTGNR
jgi:hypothetical protein